MKEFLWSFEKDIEDWNYFNGSLEECLEEIREFNKDRGEHYCTVFIGDYERYNPKEYVYDIDADYLISQITCRSQNEAWLNKITREDEQTLAEEIDTVFRRWLSDKNQEPNFGNAVNVKQFNFMNEEEIIK